MLQSYNPRNEHIKVFIGDQLYDRKDAKVSVFDSSVQGGDAVWEGLRLYENGILHLTAHLRRLRESAHALAFVDIPETNFIKNAISKTLLANEMSKDVHIRLTLTRGEKVTSGMDPRLNQNGSCLIVLAEWKPLVYDNANGIRVISSSIRRNGPQYLDSKIHHANLLNNILAKIQANFANVDAAVMLDNDGFVAELNDTNIFLIKDNQILTPNASACLPGITRQSIIEALSRREMLCIERQISLTELYNADLVFASGTMGQLTPIVEADGRKIGNEKGRGIFVEILAMHEQENMNHCEMI
jgi:branched-chain amino acid aminotransferase